MVDHTSRATPRQSIARPLMPRTRAGRCGTCGGLLTFDEDLSGDKCCACGRLAGPAPPPTPEEIRSSILADLTAQVEGLLSQEDFAKTYVLLADLGRICGSSNLKVFREWLTYHEWPVSRRRSPSTGQWARYVTVSDAQAIIRARQ